jgi:oxalate decarboxylase
MMHMPKPQRREFLLGAAGLSAIPFLGDPAAAQGGDVSFQNNVPDPVVSGKELPTFKFEL